MLNLAIVVAEPSRGLGGASLFAAFLMPPVIMHNVYLSLASKLGSVGAQKRWMAPVYLMYAVAFGSEVAFFGDLVVANPITALFGPYIGHTINGTFLLAVGFMISMSFRTRTRAAREGARAASGRRWFVGLSALLFVLTLTGVLFAVSSTSFSRSSCDRPLCAFCLRVSTSILVTAFSTSWSSAPASRSSLLLPCWHTSA